MSTEDDRMIREAAAKGDLDTFAQLAEKSPDLLFTIDDEGRIPTQYAKDVDTYVNLLFSVPRTPSKINMSSLEARLDALYARRDNMTPTCTLQGLSKEVYNFKGSAEAHTRICKKLTWLNVYPRDYNDGAWEKF